MSDVDSENYEAAIYVACPARADQPGHVRECGAQPLEGCHDRTYTRDVAHGIHDARTAAWAKLSKEQRRGILVKLRLEGKLHG